jgi:hypothetical protein
VPPRIVAIAVRVSSSARGEGLDLPERLAGALWAAREAAQAGPGLQGDRHSHDEQHAERVQPTEDALRWVDVLDQRAHQ